MKLTYEELTTNNTEIEDIFNNCPLTYTYGNEIDKVFTSAYLCCGTRFLDGPDDLADDEEMQEMLNLPRQQKLHQCI